MRMLGITGAGGVLGSILIPKLHEMGFETSSFPGDICSREDIKEWLSKVDLDGIIHLAAIVATSDVIDNPLLAFNVNVSGTINIMLEASERWRGERKWFFLASTSHVYASKDTPISEDDDLLPTTLYGKTKLLAEKVVFEIGKIKAYPFDVCIGRIFSFYHKTQKRPFLYPNIKFRLEHEDLSKPFFLPGANCVRDFSNAEDIADIIAALAVKRSSGIFNIASGKPISIRDFVQALSPERLQIVTDKKVDSLVANVNKLRIELYKNE